MCEWLDASRAGYYQWASRPASATARPRATLATLIEGIFDASGKTYGARRVTTPYEDSSARDAAQSFGNAIEWGDGSTAGARSPPAWVRFTEAVLPAFSAPIRSNQQPSLGEHH